jgi:glycosyltransferase involved in cell wall biosynthesis
VRQALPGLRRHTPTARYTFNFDTEPPIDEAALFAIPRGEVDVICLHWITGLLNARLMRRLHEHYRCPLIWVMADQEPMTGGCHYSFGCNGFTKQCGACPQLDSQNPADQSHRTWQRKRHYLAELPLCFVAPTNWGLARIKQSSLFRQQRAELIPYPIDVHTFRPFEQRVARDLLQLPFDKKIIFCGATYLADRRKGMEQLIVALTRLAEMIDASSTLSRADVFLLVAGLNGKPLMAGLPLAGKYIGLLQDSLTLALAYQAADVFLCPSLEDAGPMMIPEALLCGTPVVAFNAGGAPDLIATMKTGYLAELPNADDLARGVYAVLTHENLPAMRAAARAAAVYAHAPETVAQHYLQLCASLLVETKQ